LQPEHQRQIWSQAQRQSSEGALGFGGGGARSFCLRPCLGLGRAFGVGWGGGRRKIKPSKAKGWLNYQVTIDGESHLVVFAR
jgi:hypothetical protein